MDGIIDNLRLIGSMVFKSHFMPAFGVVCIDRLILF